MLRAPNGVIDDVLKYWSSEKPFYDPGKITVPTFIIHAEWDADLPSYQAQAYFKELTHTPYKRFVELSEGTHTVMMEKIACNSSARSCCSSTKKIRSR